MKDSPILMSAPMVRALLAGSKTQTRRIAKAANDGDGLECRDTDGWPMRDCSIDGIGEVRTASPYGQPGDRLWVRETFIQGWPCIDGNPDQYNEDGSEKPIHTWYRASDPGMGWTDDDGGTAEKTPWKPSIFMPRTASRITLEVTGVRVERLHAISRGDAMSEGCPFPNMAQGDDPRQWYAKLWEQINGAGSWNLNPWVWVVEFKRVQP